jgi:hypothetical protein
LSTELAVIEGDDNTPAVLVNPHDEKMFDEVSASGKWLPRIQLFGGNSGEVKEGKIPMAHWGFVITKANLLDLGTDFDFMPLLWRPKAMELGEQIISCYKPKTEIFERIQAQSEIQDSGCMYGPEYLVWVPSLKRFGTLFLSTKTARKAAPSLQQLMLRPATAKSEFIKTKKYSWHGPVFTKCSTPFDLPPEEDSIDEQKKFLSPPESEVEIEPETNTSRPR